VESSESHPPSASTIPTPLQSVGLVAAAILVLILAHALFQVSVATLFFDGDQRAQMGDMELSLFLNDPAWIVLGTAVPHLILGAALVALVIRRRMPLDEVLPLRVPGPLSLIGALVVVVGMTPLADAVYGAVSRLVNTEGVIEASVILERALAGAGPVQLVGVIIGFAVVPALVEESLFRGVVTAAHRRSFWGALLAPAVLFGLTHMEPAQVAGTMVLGIAFGLARLFSGSLFTAIFAHAVYNTIVIVTAHMNHEGLDALPSTATVVGGILLALVGVFLLPMGRTRPPSPAPQAFDD
jgi:hypothetical protein